MSKENPEQGPEINRFRDYGPEDREKLESWRAGYVESLGPAGREVLGILSRKSGNLAGLPREALDSYIDTGPRWRAEISAAERETLYTIRDLDVWLAAQQDAA